MRSDFNLILVALADEVGSPPGVDANVWNILTFQAVNTGLSYGFKVETLQGGSQYTFDDSSEGGPSYVDALSVGDINNFEDDDWSLTLLDGATMMDFGVVIRDSDSSDSGEPLTLYSGATLMETFNFSILGAGTYVSQFIGVTTGFAFDRVVFNEFAGGDDMAIADFYFETSAQPVPEPGTIALPGIGLAGLAGAEVRRRQKKRTVDKRNGL